MEETLRSIYQEKITNRKTLGILIMEKKSLISPETDNFDAILLVIARSFEEKWSVKHYEFGEKSAALHIIDKGLLNEWMETSTYRRALEWIIYGEIIYDKNKYLAKLKETLRVFPQEKRALRLMIEFSKLTRTYTDACNLYYSSNFMDAYSRLIRSLHYLARITILEKGYHPEVMVWDQVKRMDPEVYKLYEELIRSTEGLKKRVELMLLAIEFALSKRTETCAEHLVHLMKERTEPWGFEELKTLPEVSAYKYDLTSAVEYLVSKNILEVIREDADNSGLQHRKYKIRVK